MSVGTVRQACKDSIVNGNGSLPKQKERKGSEREREAREVCAPEAEVGQPKRRTVQNLRKRTFLSQLIDSEDANPVERKRKLVVRKEAVDHEAECPKLRDDFKPANYGLSGFSLDLSDQ